MASYILTMNKVYYSVYQWNNPRFIGNADNNYMKEAMRCHSEVSITDTAQNILKSLRALSLGE